MGRDGSGPARQAVHTYTGSGPALCWKQESSWTGQITSAARTPAAGPQEVPGIERVLPGGEGTQRSNGNGIAGRLPAHCLESLRQGTFLVQEEVGHHEGQGCRDPEISHEADEEGHDDANGNRALRVPGFLPCVETRGSIES